MLADTNRQNSREGEPPGTAGHQRAVGAEQENPIGQPASGAGPPTEPEQNLVVSEHLFVDFDRQLSRGENRPTLLYKVCVVGSIPGGLSFPFGVIAMPGISAAWEHDDALSAYWCLSFMVLFVVVTPLFVQECRSVFRSDAEGPLVLLGAGKQLISEAQDTAVRRMNLILNWTFGRPIYFLNAAVAWTPLFAPFIIMAVAGAGSDAPMFTPYNDEKAAIGHFQIGLTSILILFFCWTTVQVYYSWGTALFFATTLITAKTDAIRYAISRELQQPRGEEYWQSAIVSPCKDLVAALAVLTESFSRGLILQVSYFLLYCTGYPCALLSKSFDDLWSRRHDLNGFDDAKAHLDVHPILPYGFLFMGVVAIFLTTGMTFMPVYLLGAVSTACDDLTEDLNKMRLERFSGEVDERVSMLERAFKGCNHGQGSECNGPFSCDDDSSTAFFSV